MQTYNNYQKYESIKTYENFIQNPLKLSKENDTYRGKWGFFEYETKDINKNKRFHK